MENKTWAKQHNQCILCGSTNIPHKAKGLCCRCYQNTHNYPKYSCSICEKLAQAHKYIDNKPICKSCYTSPKHTCEICGLFLPSALSLADKRYICYACYNIKYRPKDICSKCGELNLIAVISDDKKLCVKCYNSPTHYCSKCGRNINSPYIYNNSHICKRCYQTIKNINNPLLKHVDISIDTYYCSICGNKNDVQKIYRDGSIICSECHNKSEKLCTDCKKQSNKVYSHINSIPYCRDCFFKKKVNNYLYSLTTLYDVTYVNLIASYFEAKSQTINFESMFNRIDKFDIIAKSFYKDFKIPNHNFSIINLIYLYKEIPNSTLLINDFLFYLATEGFIDMYDINYRLFDFPKLDINYLPENFRILLDSYKKFLLKKHDNYKEKGWTDKYIRFGYYTCYLYILSGFRLLSWIYDKYKFKHIAEISDNILDDYLKAKPYDRGNLKHFIKYINQHSKSRTFINISLPNTNYSHQLQCSLSEDSQKDLIEICRNNNLFSVRDRLIILFMIIYGLRPEEIQSLKITDFNIEFDNRKIVQFKYNNLVFDLVDFHRLLFTEYMSKNRSNSNFIFPGRIHNSPISISTICRILKSHNITARQLRYTAINNALLNGIDQPALLMKLFNIHYNTATRYFDLIKNTFV